MTLNITTYKRTTNKKTRKSISASDRIKVWQRIYDYQKNKYTYEKHEKLSSDKNGYVKVKSNRNGRGDIYIQIELTTKDDHLFLDENTYSYYRPENGNEEQQTKKEYEEDNRKVFLFTDRSIYRPGQTAYFKGIVVTKDFVSKQYKIVRGFKTKVFLHDTNGEEVDSLELSTNEFGSYNGKFRLPENRLNGEFAIQEGRKLGGIDCEHR